MGYVVAYRKTDIVNAETKLFIAKEELLILLKNNGLPVPDNIEPYMCCILTGYCTFTGHTNPDFTGPERQWGLEVSWKTNKEFVNGEEKAKQEQKQTTTGE